MVNRRNARPSHALASAIGLVVLVVLSACGGPGSDPAVSESATPGDAVVEGTFDVGDRDLYLRCVGEGSPTVVYFHGYIADPGGGGSGNAGSIPGLLAEEVRVCVYDRANVGRSDPAEGPLSAADAVADLDALLAAAGIEPPYVLLGASFGGLVAYTYAGTHPDKVAGAVLLDPSLPGERELESLYLPDLRLGPDDWQDATEQMDMISSWDDAYAVAESVPAVPALLLRPPDVDSAPWAMDPAAWPAAVAAAREAMMAPFEPGDIVEVDAPHYMEPVIPDEIARHVLQVIAAVGS